MDISSQFFKQSDRGITLVFLDPLLQNSNGNPLSGDVKYTGSEKLAIFNGNRRLSRKRYEIGPCLLWMTDRKSYVADRYLSVPVTSSDCDRRDMRLNFSGRFP